MRIVVHCGEEWFAGGLAYWLAADGHDAHCVADAASVPGAIAAATAEILLTDALPGGPATIPAYGALARQFPGLAIVFVERPAALRGTPRAAVLARQLGARAALAWPFDRDALTKTLRRTAPEPRAALSGAV